MHQGSIESHGGEQSKSCWRISSILQFTAVVWYLASQMTGRFLVFPGARQTNIQQREREYINHFAQMSAMFIRNVID